MNKSFDLKYRAQHPRITYRDHRFMFKITGAEQICPKDFQEVMRSCNFKSLLLRFLADRWRNQAYLDIIKGHILYVGIEDKAYRYDVHVNIVQRYGFDELVCSHEEADTRLIWHVKHICENIFLMEISLFVPMIPM